PAATVWAIPSTDTAFDLDRPKVLRASTSCAITARADSSPTPALKRLQIEFAEAVDTCCPMMIRTRPANPASLARHSNGPAAAGARARVGSRELSSTLIFSISLAERPRDVLFVGLERIKL